MWNIGFKAISLLMFMQVRIGFSFRPYVGIAHRPAGRLWLYDVGLMYFGTYSYLLSHIMGPKMV